MQQIFLFLLMLMAMVTDLACASHHNAEPSEPPETLTLAILDVGQGDAALIIGPEPIRRTVLIDTGDSRHATDSLVPALQTLLLPEELLDVVVATHFDSDHIGGIAALADAGLVNSDTWFVEPAAAQSATTSDTYATWLRIASSGVRLEAWQLGSAIDLSQGALLKVLAADGRLSADGPRLDESDNGRSIALNLSFGRFDYFTGGDLTATIEQALLQAPAGLASVDVAKLNHHGGAECNTPEFLQALNPSVVLISVGDSDTCGPGFNKYGHPAQASLDAVASVSSVQQILQTEQGGARFGQSDSASAETCHVASTDSPRDYHGVPVEFLYKPIVIETDSQWYDLWASSETPMRFFAR